jgi:Alginate lyase
MPMTTIAIGSSKHQFLIIRQSEVTQLESICSWWPACPENVVVKDPTHECPYKSIRGKVNPDVYDIGDHQQLQKMAVDVMTLAVAWSLLDEDRFADRAAILLRTWFINSETR